MKKMYLGKCCNTHGINGEIRIKSDILNKEEIFKIGHTLYILNDTLEIESYRRHKDYEMVSFKGINNINEVLKYKNNSVYFDRDELVLPENQYLINDLIGFDVSYDQKIVGNINDFMYNSTNCLLAVINNDKTFYIPYHDNFIDKVDMKKKIVIVKNVGELLK